MSRRGPSARRAALHGLTSIERGRKLRLREAVDMSGLDVRDRRLAWELAQGTERSHLLLDFVLEQFVDRRLPKDPQMLSALRLGAYQLLFMTRVPPWAAIDEAVGMFGRRGGFLNAVLRRVAAAVRARAVAEDRSEFELALPPGPEGERCLVLSQPTFPPASTAAGLALRHGLPGFLVDRWERAYGSVAASEVCRASSSSPTVWLRSIGIVDLPAELAAEGVVVEQTGAGLAVRSGDPFATRCFAAGRFLAQDPTAAAAVDALRAAPGERILDLCAAPGTKTAVLAERVGSTGRVVAFDPDASRRDLILENASRLGFEDRVELSSDPESDAPFDRVLVDAPCSNTGVLARRVEVRRRLREPSIADLAATQRQILTRGLALLRPGGVAVYSTCSIESDENRAVVDAVLQGSAGAEFDCADEATTLPRQDGPDGGYHAVLIRKTRGLE